MLIGWIRPRHAGCKISLRSTRAAPGAAAQDRVSARCVDRAGVVRRHAAGAVAACLVPSQRSAAMSCSRGSVARSNPPAAAAAPLARRARRRPGPSLTHPPLAPQTEPGRFCKPLIAGARSHTGPGGDEAPTTPQESSTRPSRASDIYADTRFASVARPRPLAYRSEQPSDGSARRNALARRHTKQRPVQTRCTPVRSHCDHSVLAWPLSAERGLHPHAYRLEHRCGEGRGLRALSESKTIEPDRGDYYLSPDGEPTQAPGGWSRHQRP